MATYEDVVRHLNDACTRMSNQVFGFDPPADVFSDENVCARYDLFAGWIGDMGFPGTPEEYVEQWNEQDAEDIYNTFIGECLESSHGWA